MKYETERADVIKTAQEMLELNLTLYTSGNVSKRVAEGMLITPSSIPYPDIKPEQVALMDLDGNQLEGEATPSAEHKVHLACYKLRADIGAVIHSHPQAATAFAAARVPLPAFLDEFGVFVGEEVRVADYAMSGTQDIAEHVTKALADDSSACFLASHGLVSVAGSLGMALRVTRMVERACLTYLWGQTLGGVAELPEEVRSLFRQMYQFMRAE
jgi:L-fuculose-phosphate aldolase